MLDLLADWPAWTSWAGMRNWAHKSFPCPKCNIPKHVMRSADSIAGVSLRSWAYQEYTHEQYLQELSLQLVVSQLL